MFNKNYKYILSKTDNIMSIIKLNINKVREKNDKSLLFCLKHSINQDGIFKARILNCTTDQCWMELEDTMILVCVPTNIIEYIFPSIDYKKEYDAALIEIRKEKNNED